MSHVPEQSHDAEETLRRALYMGCNGGEAGDLWSEETLCTTCSHMPVCAIYRAVSAQPDLLVTIRRCRAFEPSTG